MFRVPACILLHSLQNSSSRPTLLHVHTCLPGGWLSSRVWHGHLPSALCLAVPHFCRLPLPSRRARVAQEAREAAEKEAALRAAQEEVVRAKARTKAYNEALQVRWEGEKVFWGRMSPSKPCA